jgi:hypothetical protein
MTVPPRSLRAFAMAAASLVLGACLDNAGLPSSNGGMAGGNMSGAAGSVSRSGAAGSVGGPGGTSGAAGASASGAAGQLGAAGVAASTGAAGDTSGVAGSGPGTAGGGAGVAGGGAGSGAGTPDAGETDPPPPRPLMIEPGGGCNCQFQFTAKQLDPLAGTSTNDTHAGDQQSMFVDTRKKVQGKLVIALGGLGGGPGGGGIEGYAKAQGFHVFDVATQTAVSSAPQMYKDIVAKTPLDPEANRQVGDARLEAFDGVDRVTWLDVKPPDSIVNRTEHALLYAMTRDPGGDWGFFLNADGTVRWTDVYMVGYSFGSQTIAMISKYVRFGRVFATSGPQAEGFPNATWISQPSATPVDRLYTALGFNLPYPSMDKLDAAPNDVMSMVMTVMTAGWPGDVTNVHPGDAGPFTGHIFAMIGSNANSPGGHTIFCTDNAANGWTPVCHYAFGVQ